MPSTFGSAIWSEIEAVFSVRRIAAFPLGWSCDGLIPSEVEATKRGIEVRGEIWFLVGGRGSPSRRWELQVCLRRPRFASMATVSVENIKAAEVVDFLMDDRVVCLCLQ